MNQKPLKIYPPLLSEVRHGLRQIFEQNQPADKHLLTVSRNRKFGSRDRRFIYGHIYDIIRYKRFFEHITNLHSTATIPVYDQWIIINTLRQFSEAPGSEHMLPAESTLMADWNTLLADMDIPEIIRQSFPDWMWELGSAEYGNQWPALAASLNSPASTYLRVNTLRSQPERIAAQLSKQNIETEFIAGTDAMLMKGKHKLTNNPLYTKGHFEFQDIASQQVAIYSDVEPGMLVIDACAGAGGKSLQLSALMQNEGKLLASDKYPERLKQLEFRAERAGVRNVRLIGQVGLLDYKGQADRVILDVPCSASGTIQRKPEIKWNVTRTSLNELLDVQASILQTYSSLIKSDGLITYATCSVFRCEGEEQVSKFLENNPEFKLIKEKRFYPETDHSDGFYIAVLGYK
ncbi:MAG: RsmB/NOP family class I SAM-dependent RNA methyltransferase [Bacteroidetes bacterium]|nr:RsmB/NOP family class I SAM-dependent RNA methyltransferase [Bacteroidota bacterium]